MKLADILENVIPFPNKKAPAAPANLTPQAVKALKQQVTKLCDGENEGGGRMGTWIRFAVDVSKRGTTPNVHAHRQLHNTALERLTNTFGEPKIDVKKNEIHADLKQKHAPAGTTVLDRSTYTSYAWEVNDWVIILEPFDPDSYGSCIRMFKFRDLA